MTNISVDKIKSADIFDYVSDDVLEEINCVFDDTNIAYYLEDFFKNKTTYLDIFKGISENYIRYIMKEKNSVKVDIEDIRKYIQWCYNKYNELISYKPGKYDLPIPGNSKPTTFYNMDIHYDTTIDIFTDHINRYKLPELLISTLGYSKREFVAYLQDAYERYKEYIIFKSNRLEDVKKDKELHPCILQFHCFETYYKDWFDNEYKSLVDNKDAIISKIKEMRSKIETSFNLNSADIFDEIMKNMRQYNIIGYFLKTHTIDENVDLAKLYTEAHIKKFIKYLKTKLGKEDIDIYDVKNNTDYFENLYNNLISYRYNHESDYVLDIYKKFIQFDNIEKEDDNLNKSTPTILYLIADNFARHGILKLIYDNNSKSHKDYLKTITSLILSANNTYNDYISTIQNSKDSDEVNTFMNLIMYGDEAFKKYYTEFEKDPVIKDQSYQEEYKTSLNKILNKINELSQTQYNVSDEVLNYINTKLFESGIAIYIKDHYFKDDLDFDKINSTIRRYIDYIIKNENTTNITLELVDKYDDWFAREILYLNNSSYDNDIIKYESYSSSISEDKNTINSIKCERAILDCITRSGIAAELDKYITMNRLSSDIWISTMNNMIEDYTKFCLKKKYPDIKYDNTLTIDPSDIFYYANEYFPQKYKEVVKICSTAK